MKGVHMLMSKKIELRTTYNILLRNDLIVYIENHKQKLQKQGS